MVNAKWWWEFGGRFITDEVLPPGHGGTPPGLPGGVNPGRGQGRGTGQGWGRGGRPGAPAGPSSGEASTAIATGSETELIVTWDNPAVLVMLFVSGVTNSSDQTYRIQLSETGGSPWIAGTNYDIMTVRWVNGSQTVLNGTDSLHINRSGTGRDVGSTIYLPFPGEALRQKFMARSKNEDQTSGGQYNGFGAGRTSSARQPNAARLYRSDGAALTAGASFTAIVLGPS